MILDPLPEEQILGQEVLIHRHFLQNLLDFGLVQKVNIHVLRPHAVDLIDLSLQFRQLSFALEHQHDLEDVLLGGGQEDEAPDIPDILGVVGEVGVQFEVEIDVHIQSADDCEAVGVSFLVEHQQPGAVFLPLILVDVNKHLGAGHKNQRAVVLIKPRLQFFLQQRVDLHPFFPPFQI